MDRQRALLALAVCAAALAGCAQPQEADVPLDDGTEGVSTTLLVDDALYECTSLVQGGDDAACAEYVLVGVTGDAEADETATIQPQGRIVVRGLGYECAEDPNVIETNGEVTGPCERYELLAS